MDSLSGGEVERSPGGPDVLARLADEVHLDAVALGIIEGTMVEALEIEGKFHEVTLLECMRI